MSESKDQVLRFPKARRIEHWSMAGSFIILALTGLVQKYAASPISQGLIVVMGGIEFVRIIHRASAIVLMLVSVWHVGTLIYHILVLRKRPTMLPSMDDVKAAWQSLRYNFKREKEPPKQDFYTFEEKFEYWALVWGTVVMAITGFFLWNPITAARILPAAWIPAAKAAHSGEALLAVLAIIFWHGYHVFIRHQNRSMFTGFLSRHEMEELHPLALETQENPAPSPDILKTRRSRFFAIYGVVAAALLVGIFWFVSVEETAVPVPPEIADVQGLESYTPLDPTPFPVIADTGVIADVGDAWDSGVGELFTLNCGGCHLPEVGQNGLDLTTYAGALAGGDSGPAVIPNAPGVSLVVVWPSRGDHPGVFSNAELNAIRQWIDNGAPQN